MSDQVSQVIATRATVDNTKTSRKHPEPDATASTKKVAEDDFQVKFDRMCKFLKVIWCIVNMRLYFTIV